MAYFKTRIHFTVLISNTIFATQMRQCQTQKFGHHQKTSGYEDAILVWLLFLLPRYMSFPSYAIRKVTYAQKCFKICIAQTCDCLIQTKKHLIKCLKQP